MAEQFAPWGPGNMGSRIAEQDRERAALNALALQTGQQNLQQSAELHPARAALLRAQADKEQAEAKKLQLQQLALDKWLAKRETQLDKGPASGTTPEGQLEDAAKQLAEMANFQAGVGDLEGARKTQGTLSQVVARASRAKQQEALAKKTQFEARMKMADKALGYIRGAQSQEDLRLAGDAFEMEYGVRLPVFNMPFSPQNIQRALDAGLTERQARQTQHEKEMERLRATSVGLEGIRTKATQDRTRAYVERSRASTDRIRKMGVKPDLGATTAQMKEARALLAQNHPELADSPTELEVGASSIASEARMLVRKTPGKSWAQALQEAYAHQKDDIREETKGVWAGKIPFTDTEFSVPFTGTKKTTFNAAGRTPETAMTAPAKPEDAIPGKYYTFPTGVYRYLGNGKLVKVQPGTGEANPEDTAIEAP